MHLMKVHALRHHGDDAPVSESVSAVLEVVYYHSRYAAVLDYHLSHDMIRCSTAAQQAWALRVVDYCCAQRTVVQALPYPGGLCATGMICATG